MARHAKAKLDKKGLTTLGLDKLIDILLEESVSNKQLKSRLQVALAGASGADDIALLIDKRLDSLETARTTINGARAKDLTAELQGIIRNILSELAPLDAVAAVERMLRVMGLRAGIERRLRSESARLMKAIGEAEAAMKELVLALPDAQQPRIVPLIERERKRDRYHERAELFETILVGLSRPASDLWEQILLKQFDAKEPGLTLPRLLQQLYRKRGDVDAFLKLETAKPERYQDFYAAAKMLAEAGRAEDALVWSRKTVKGPRMLFIGGQHQHVAGNYQLREMKMLEADILDQLKRKDEARAIRWAAFLDHFDAEMLRQHIARLDDFDEFDEMDRALAIIRSTDRIYDALKFLIEWPKLDLAAEHVFRNKGQWDGRRERALLDAADALAEKQPAAASLLFRILVTSVLDRTAMDDYPDAVTWMMALDVLKTKLPPDAPIESHEAFTDALMDKHPRKYGFWRLLNEFSYYTS